MRNILLLFVVLLLGFSAWYYSQYPPTSSVTIRDHKIFIELALTNEEKQNGLSNRKSLPQDQGMLFLMNEPAYHGFWMQGMRFPLDFIWISGKTVVDISENVPSPISNEPPVSLKPRVPADKVLEVNAGVIKRISIQVGDTIEFNR